MLPSETKTYLSADSVNCDDNEEAQNYPMEFLNSLTPSGMPPHCLNLKVGSIVMLLRNISLKKGLCNGTRLVIYIKTVYKQKLFLVQIVEIMFSFQE